MWEKGARRWPPDAKFQTETLPPHTARCQYPVQFRLLPKASAPDQAEGPGAGGEEEVGGHVVISWANALDMMALLRLVNAYCPKYDGTRHPMKGER